MKSSRVPLALTTKWKVPVTMMTGVPLLTNFRTYALTTRTRIEDIGFVTGLRRRVITRNRVNIYKPLADEGGRCARG